MQMTNNKRNNCIMMKTQILNNLLMILLKFEILSKTIFNNFHHFSLRYVERAFNKTKIKRS